MEITKKCVEKLGTDLAYKLFSKYGSIPGVMYIDVNSDVTLRIAAGNERKYDQEKMKSLEHEITLELTQGSVRALVFVVNEVFLDACLEGDDYYGDIETFANSAAPKKKDMTGKLKLSLVPRGIIEKITEVREFGNSKYGNPDGWKLMSKQDYWEACLRHAEKARNDITAVDEESGLPHLYHLACDLAFVLSNEMWGE